MMNEQYLYEKAKEHKGKDFLQIATAFNHTIRIYVTKTTVNRLCRQCRMM